MKFTELGLSSGTLTSIQKLGFETPTPIQAEAIPFLLSKEQDLIGLASTGTGKTAAFGLPLIERVDDSLAVTQAVVLAPTRELGVQIAEDMKRFAVHRPGLKIAAVYGGTNIVPQIKALKAGAQIVVATPGRLVDLIERKAARLEQVRALVLDEADEMLNMGFKEEIDKILSRAPEERLTWLFSATMAKGVERIAGNYLKNPHTISVGGRNEAAANIEHLCFMVNERDRFPALKRVLDALPEIYGVVFCRTRAETQTVAEKLLASRYSAEALHGDLSQAQRDTVMRKFRQRTVRILVATDVAARGIDVDDITHVLHYKLSDEVAAYTHRCGRTARAGKSGVSIALINSREKRRIMDLERRNGITIRLEKLPDGRAVCESQLMTLLERVVKTSVNEEAIADYLPPAYEALCHLDKKEIIKRFVSVEFNHFLDSYADAPDLNAKAKAPRERGGRGERGTRGERSTQRSENSKRNQRLEAYDTKRFSINIGKVHQANSGAIVRLICEHCDVKSNQIGSINVGREASVFEVSKEVGATVRKGMERVELDGRKVSIRAASGGKPGGSGRAPNGGRSHRGGKPRRKHSS